MILIMALMNIFGFSSKMNVQANDEYIWGYQNAQSYSDQIKNTLRIKVIAESSFEISPNYTAGDYLIQIDVFDTIGTHLCKDSGKINNITGSMLLGNHCGISFPDINSDHFRDHNSNSNETGVNDYHLINTTFGELAGKFFSGYISTGVAYWNYAKDSLVQLENIGVIYYDSLHANIAGNSYKSFRLKSINGTSFDFNEISSSRIPGTSQSRLHNNSVSYSATGTLKTNNSSNYILSVGFSRNLGSKIQFKKPEK